MRARLRGPIVALLAVLLLPGLAAAAAERPVEVLVRLNADAAGRVLDKDARGVAAKGMSLRAAQAAVLGRLAATPKSAGAVAGSVRKATLYEVVPGMGLVIDRSLLDRLRADPLVADVEEVRPERMDATLRKDSPTLDSMDVIRADSVLARGFSGRGQAVAILDTGVDRNHPMLAGKVVSEACFSTPVPGYARSTCPNGAARAYGVGAAASCGWHVLGCDHGTHVAGIAAGRARGSARGVARNAQVIAVQVFARYVDDADCDGLAPCALSSQIDQVAGLERVYQLRARFKIAAVNMSLGGGAFAGACDRKEGLRALMIDKLADAGIATVAAAGNEGLLDAINAPACIRRAVAVGATALDDTIPFWSNYGVTIDLMAPGVDIKSAKPYGGFRVLSGTSMAAPHVAGAYALLREAVPTATPAAILGALREAGMPVAFAGVTRPRINLAPALNLLQRRRTLVAAAQAG